MRFPGFIGPSYTLRTPNVDCQRSVNLYPEVDDLGTGKEHEVAHLAPTPGLKKLLTIGSGPVRGLWQASNGSVFAVSGNKFYRIADDWTSVESGTLVTTNGPVSISDNGIQVVIVDGLRGYVYTLASAAFNTITDPNFPGADQVTFQDGYFLFNHPGTGQFFFSAIEGTTFDALDFATAEASPDNLIGILASNQKVFMPGTQSIEVFYDSGDNDNPWQRIQGAVVEVGVSSAFSIAKLPVDGFVFVGGDQTGQGIVYRMQGTQPQRISNAAVENDIRRRSADEIAKARGWVYQQGGHVFYNLNIPGSDKTWVFDLTTGQWHDRVYLHPTNTNPAGFERHRADCHAIAFGHNIVGDYQNGNIYELDQDTYTDDGVSIVRMRTAPHITKELRRVLHSRFQLDLEAGVGLDGGTGQGRDPMAILQWSDDGGHSWSNEHYAKIGKIGQTRYRALWRRLGASRDRVYRVTITDPVRVFLIGAEIGLEETAA